MRIWLRLIGEWHDTDTSKSLNSLILRPGLILDIQESKIIHFVLSNEFLVETRYLKAIFSRAELAPILK